MKTFFQLCNEIEDKNWNQVLFQYLRHIESNPNFDDFVTLLKMFRERMKDQTIASGLLADMLPQMEKVISKFSPEEQEQAQKFIVQLDPSLHGRLAMLRRGWLPSSTGPNKLYTARQLEDYLEELMQQPHPSLETIKGLIDANRDLFAHMDKGYQQYVLSWFKQEVEKQQKQPTIGDAIKKHIAGGPDWEPGQ